MPQGIYDLQKNTAHVLGVIAVFTYTRSWNGRYMLWVNNHGPDPVQVQFIASVDGGFPDMSSLDAVMVPVGQSATVEMDGLHRYWTVTAGSTTANVCTVDCGVVVDPGA